MGSKSRFFVTVVLPVIYYSAQAVFVLPAIRAFLGTQDLPTQLAVQVPMIGLFGWYHLGPVRKKYKKFQQLEKQRAEIMREFHHSRLSKVLGANEAAALRVNVMMVGRTGIRYREPHPDNPSKRTFTFAKPLKYEYISDTMKAHGGALLKLTCNQGLCGEAVRTGQALMLDTNTEDLAKFNFTQEQRDRTKDVKFVLSQPIYKIKDGELLPNVIGCLNIDSSSDLAQKLVKNPKKRTQLEKQCKALAELSSNLFG